MSSRITTTPIMKQAGFKMLKGNLFDSAIMKTSVISKEFRDRYLSNPKDPNAFEAKAIVFDGPEDYHKNIDNPALGIDENTILFMRGTGPLGYPGAAEVVNMRAPSQLIEERRALIAVHRRRPPVGNFRLALDPQCLAGSGSRRRSRASQEWRQGADRSQQGHRRYAGAEGRARETPRQARFQWRLSGAGKPDAVAGTVPRQCRSTWRRAWS